MKLWLDENGRVLVDADGRPFDCEVCPCPTGSGSGNPIESVPCDGKCRDGIMSSELKLVIAGITNNHYLGYSCDDCAKFNGTYYLRKFPESNPCEWELCVPDITYCKCPPGQFCIDFNTYGAYLHARLLDTNVGGVVHQTLEVAMINGNTVRTNPVSRRCDAAEGYKVYFFWQADFGISPIDCMNINATLPLAANGNGGYACSAIGSTCQATSA